MRQGDEQMFLRDMTVRFGECDGLGHVNNGTYFTYMEDARMDVFQLFNPGLDLHTWNLIVASTRCDFLQPVTYAETITVLTWISRVGTSSFDVDHALRNIAGEWVARGRATLVSYSYETATAVPIPEDVRMALSAHREEPTGAPVIR